MKLTRAKLEALVDDLIERDRRALRAGAEGRGRRAPTRSTKSSWSAA
jgi:hypothetical protein